MTQLPINDRFTISTDEWVATGKIRVLDNGVLTPGRFHTVEQAQSWIEHKLNPPQPELEERVRRILRLNSYMPGRARSYLITPELLSHMRRMVLPNAGY